MVNGVASTETVSVDRIFLDHENPRHEPYESQSEVIEYLCRDEYVYQLAKDIVKHGLNPLELFALIPLDKKKGTRSTASYVVAEGNRRMCAIMLLNDPELAPAKQRKDFKKLAEEAEKIPEVLAVIFDDKESVGIWLDRIHGGLQGGIGRKPWSAEQKTRHVGDDRKNLLAQTILDYAEKHGFISALDRKGKITTVQRYLGNALLREALGVDNSNLEDISRNRQKNDFDLLLKRFVDDLISGVVNSRSNSDDIVKYSRNLSTTKGQSGKRTEPESLSPAPSKDAVKKKPQKTPQKPEKPKHITYEEEIYDRLKAIPSFKLEQIYYSICSIELEPHTPLIAVGVWSFLESLTAKTGRVSGTDFNSFLSKNKLQTMGLGDGTKTASMRQAIKRISEYGNTTKHHETAAHFDSMQLHNDMETIKELLSKLAEEAKKSKP